MKKKDIKKIIISGRNGPVTSAIGSIKNANTHNLLILKLFNKYILFNMYIINYHFSLI